MTDHLHDLSASQLRHVAAALRTGRLAEKPQGASVSRFVPSSIANSVAIELCNLAAAGLSSSQVAVLLEALATQVERQSASRDAIDLVTSGPETMVVANRDTSVVIRELFSQATQSVLVAGYAVQQGPVVFRELADQMASNPGLDVRLYLDVQRRYGDTTAVEELVRKFCDQFRQKQWPADRPLPRVFYYPASLKRDMDKRASMHAKCVVIDRSVLFVSSANFTEAAQERNIEVGLLVRSRQLSDQLCRHFEALADQGALMQLI